MESQKYRVDACSIHSEYIIPAGALYPGKSFQEKALAIAKKTNGKEAVNIYQKGDRLYGKRAIAWSTYERKRKGDYTLTYHGLQTNSYYSLSSSIRRQRFLIDYRLFKN